MPIISGKTASLGVSPARPVEIPEFYDHRAKLVAVASFIGTDRSPVGMRLARLCLDWRDDRWAWNDAPIDPQAVKVGIDAVQAAIGRAWLPWS